MQKPFPAAESSNGVFIQPRKFEFRDLESVPQHWFADNPIVTHIENAFSILIPPGERFFIRAVKNFEDHATDPELADLIRAFVQQEGLHMRAHHELNASFKKFGVDVDREVAYAEKVFAWIEDRVPKKIQLGMTAFLEHLTATGAHILFMVPEASEAMHPEMARFWRWHAVEELEHKSVAYDLFQNIGGGYFTRIFSALVALVLLARPFERIASRMIRQDQRRITSADRQVARDLQRKLTLPQLKFIARYFLPGFHPTEFDDSGFLQEWYAAPANV